MKKSLICLSFIFFSLFVHGQTTYTIPVVVHVMHTGEPVGDSLNPTDETILKSINNLNEIYSGNSLGASSGTGETNFRFELAKSDQLGNCTNGITRHDLSSYVDYSNHGVRPLSSISSNYTLGLTDATLKSIEWWDNTKYINIYLVKKINGNGFLYINNNENTSGYSMWLSGYVPATDGIVIKTHFIHYTQFPTTSIQIKNMLGHEMGHMLNLYHVFEDDLILCLAPIQPSCNNSGDKVCDTKPVSVWTGLPRSGSNPCTGWVENYDDYTEKNIMSYTLEPVLFTPDQKVRMLNTIQNISYRNSLINGNNALTTPNSDLIITEPINNNSQISFSASSTPIFLNYKLKNIGSTTATNPNYISFHLSADSILTPGVNGDAFLSDTLYNQSVDGLTASTLLSKQLIIPSNKPIGEYYIFISADATNANLECSETNNFATTKLYIVDTNAIVQYKYWFDNDFSNAIIATNYFNNGFLNAEIPLPNISEGVHTIHFQFKGIGDVWSSISSSLFVKNHAASGGGEMRYWFDNDFGTVVTNAITTINDFQLNSNIDLSNLTDGLHSINFQFKPLGLTWSSITSSLFIKNPIAQFGGNIIQYWFDDGFSNAVSASSPIGNQLNLVQDMDFVNISEGLHSIHFRFKMSDGRWSSISSSLFYKSPHGSNLISTVQYWFDNNFNSAVSLSILPNALVDYNNETDVLNLSTGVHIINHRFRMENGLWSSIIRDSIIKVNNYSTFSIKTYLEGYYAGNGLLQSVLFNQGQNLPITLSDTVTVELHEPTYPYTVYSSRKELLETNGNISTILPSLTAQSKYISIKHRNSIETWSANPVLLSQNTQYDFTTGSYKAFADNQFEIEPGIWAIYSGDINQDGYIDGFDYPAFDTDSQNNVSGLYVNTDLNGDGYVDGFDYPLFDANSQNNVQVLKP